jgi:hypothetical protein
MELYVGRALTVAAGVLAVTALFSGSAVAANKTFALVVTNNRSTTLSLPDLRYADDDGARYYRLFRSVADKDGVALLTTFDRASAAAFPDLADVARPPTRAALEEAVVRLAAMAAAARQQGDATTFYFVYAGHGEVEQGRGFVDLEDGKIDGEFIESNIVEKIPADTKHVVLDSCNSFFVMNPRKPGGRRWATPKDMALGFAKRHPEVGLFLSTNSDAEVFEWSELESGVFSHEVRSGLSGAADVDGDGRVSYAELAGFVDQANSRIAREALRPHIYHRGPNGDSGAALFSPAQAAGRRLALPERASRLWVKNESGERLIDVHKEAGPMTLVLPGPPDQSVTIYVERAADRPTDRPTVEQYEAPATNTEIRLAELEPADPASLARGARLFAALFETPYGPVAYRSYLAARATESEPVYGLRDRDIAQMYHYTSEMAAADRKLRLVGGGLLLVIGFSSTAVAAASYFDTPRWSVIGGRTSGAIGTAVTLTTLGLGTWVLARKSDGERVLETFQREVASGEGQATAFIRTEAALEAMAKSDRRWRNIMCGVFVAIGLINLGSASVQLANPPMRRELQPSTAANIIAAGALMITLGVAARTMDLPTERLLRLYRSDPGLQVGLDVAPVAGGASLGLSGTF